MGIEPNQLLAILVLCLTVELSGQLGTGHNVGSSEQNQKRICYYVVKCNLT